MSLLEHGSIIIILVVIFAILFIVSKCMIYGCPQEPSPEEKCEMSGGIPLYRERHGKTTHYEYVGCKESNYG